MDIKTLKQSAANELMQLTQLEASDNPADRGKAAMIRSALAGLSDRDRDVLEQFYVLRKSRRDGHPARLSEKYGVCEVAIYKYKDQALLHYCVCMLAAQLAKGKQEVHQ